MNQGFSFYFTSGIRNACRALKRTSFVEKVSLLAYFLMSFIGKLFFITRPIFLIGDANLAIMAKECDDFTFEKVFANCGDFKRYFKLLVTSFIIEFMVICGVAICMIPGLVTFMFLETLTTKIYATYVTIMCLAFVPFALIALFYIVIVLITYHPIGYLMAKNRNLDVGDLLLISRRCMKGRKWTFFITNFAYSFILLAIYGLSIAGCTTLVMYGGISGLIIMLIIAVALLILTIYFIQKLFLGNITSNVYFYDSADLNHISVTKPSKEDKEVLETVIPDDQIVDKENNED